MIKKISFIAVPLLTLAFVFTALRFMPTGSDSPLIPDMLAQIEYQAEVDQMLLDELNSGAHSFDEPLVVIDPYGMSPLTALALFTTDEPMNISVHILGKTELANVDFTFDGYNTTHQIPIYGLYSGELNTVELTAKLQDDTIKTTTLQIQTDPLPPELEKNIIQTDLAQPDNYQPGFNFTFFKKSAFDVIGGYRWYCSDFGLLYGMTYNYNGNMIFAKGAHKVGDVLLFEINHLGKILSVYYSPYGVHHDITAMDGKNLLVTGSNGETVEDFIYEVDVETGKIVNTMDLKQILQRTRIQNQADWFHNNAIVYDNGKIIISGRVQSAVAKLSWPEGKIDWILSDHSGWLSMFQKYLLDPVGDNFEWQYHQHAPEILPDYDNNPDTIDILLFDNGGMFNGVRDFFRTVANDEIDKAELYSRMVHYRVNERDRTIEQIWQFGKELGETYYSIWLGDANLLENGNRFGTYDIREDDDNSTYVIAPEVDTTGEVVWEAYITTTEGVSHYSAYRIERHPMYSSAANNLKIGTPARNLIPEEKLP